MRLRNLFLLVLASVAPVHAQSTVLLTRVTDVQGRPMEGIRISVIGMSTNVTNQNGLARILLAPEVKPGDWVTIDISNSSKNLVIVSPWDRLLVIPPLESQTF